MEKCAVEMGLEGCAGGGRGLPGPRFTAYYFFFAAFFFEPPFFFAFFFAAILSLL